MKQIWLNTVGPGTQFSNNHHCNPSIPDSMNIKRFLPTRLVGYHNLQPFPCPLSIHKYKGMKYRRVSKLEGHWNVWDTGPPFSNWGRGNELNVCLGIGIREVLVRRREHIVRLIDIALIHNHHNVDGQFVLMLWRTCSVPSSGRVNFSTAPKDVLKRRHHCTTWTFQ